MLLAQPLFSSALGRIGIVPILAVGAAASEASGEGAAFGLVSAADAAGGLAAGAVSTLSAGWLHLGNPPARSWAPLPLFILLCAAAKLAVAPAVLLLLRVRERTVRGPSPTQALPRLD